MMYPDDLPCLDCGATVGNFIHMSSSHCGSLYGCTITPGHKPSDHHTAKMAPPTALTDADLDRIRAHTSLDFESQVIVHALLAEVTRLQEVIRTRPVLLMCEHGVDGVEFST